MPEARHAYYGSERRTRESVFGANEGGELEKPQKGHPRAKKNGLSGEYATKSEAGYAFLSLVAVIDHSVTKKASECRLRSRWEKNCRLPVVDNREEDAAFCVTSAVNSQTSKKKRDEKKRNETKREKNILRYRSP